MTAKTAEMIGVKNIGIGILTADCAPILILDIKKKIIAAIHAGWKGAYKNIVIKKKQNGTRKKLNFNST